MSISQKELNIEMKRSADHADYEKLEFLLMRENIKKSPQTSDQEEENLTTIKYLLNSEFLKKTRKLPMLKDFMLIYAARQGYINIMSYLLTSKEVKIKPNFEIDFHGALSSACENGQLEAAKYLLNSTDLKDHPSIDELGGSPLNNAATKDRLEIVKYLLTATELKARAKPNTHFFRCAIKGEHVLRWLITEYKFPLSKEVQQFMEANPEVKNVDLAKELFWATEQKTQLKNDQAKNPYEKAKSKRI